jgi:site-specific DNA recombinase
MNTRHLQPADLAGKRWRGLVRESSEAQADKWSPERQREDLRRAGDELGMVRAEPLFYERVGSGEAVGVEELRQALADGKAGQYDVLVVLHTSRFARNRAEAVRMKAEFRKGGIIIYFAAQRLISGTYVGGLTEGISEVIDEQENEQRRFWIAGGLRQRQASGRWVGVIPVGYRRRLVDFPDGTRGWDGALELDPVLAKVVRRIYDEAAAGFGCRRIAVGLNAEGLRTNHGRLWAYGTVHDILTNGVYAGRMLRYRRVGSLAYYEADGADGRADLGPLLPPIVDATLWGQVRETTRGRRTRGPSSPTGRTYPLSNVLRCVKCGYAMTGVNNSVHRYYRCAGRTRFKMCDARAIRADIAEDQFAAWIGSYHLPDDWRTEIARTSLDRVKVDERDRRVNADERLKRLRDLYSWGDLSKDDYQRQSAEIKATMAVARPGLDGLVSVAEALRDLGPVWRSARAEVQAAVPPLMLKSATVADARISEWVVRAELRPLLELCVAERSSPYLNTDRYIVRFSA